MENGEFSEQYIQGDLFFELIYRAGQKDLHFSIITVQRGKHRCFSPALYFPRSNKDDDSFFYNWPLFIIFVGYVMLPTLLLCTERG